MSLYEAIRKEGKKAGHDLSVRSVAKVAGSLRLAEVDENSSVFPTLVKQELDRLLSLGAGSDDSFRQIDASLNKGACPRCGKSMEEVKLFDYTPTTYCSECHISLWTSKDKS
jgi:hypothetical protein